MGAINMTAEELDALIEKYQKEWEDLNAPNKVRLGHPYREKELRSLQNAIALLNEEKSARMENPTK